MTKRILIQLLWFNVTYIENNDKIIERKTNVDIRLIVTNLPSLPKSCLFLIIDKTRLVVDGTNDAINIV